MSDIKASDDAPLELDEEESQVFIMTLKGNIDGNNRKYSLEDIAKELDMDIDDVRDIVNRLGIQSSIKHLNN